jgi:hypothetical protein
MAVVMRPKGTSAASHGAEYAARWPWDTTDRQPVAVRRRDRCPRSRFGLIESLTGRDKASVWHTSSRMSGESFWDKSVTIGHQASAR